MHFPILKKWRYHHWRNDLVIAAFAAISMIRVHQWDSFFLDNPHMHSELPLIKYLKFISHLIQWYSQQQHWPLNFSFLTTLSFLLGWFVGYIFIVVKSTVLSFKVTLVSFLLNAFSRYIFSRSGRSSSFLITIFGSSSYKR